MIASCTRPRRFDTCVDGWVSANFHPCNDDYPSSIHDLQFFQFIEKQDNLMRLTQVFENLSLFDFNSEIDAYHFLDWKEISTLLETKSVTTYIWQQQQVGGKYVWLVPWGMARNCCPSKNTKSKRKLNILKWRKVSADNEKKNILNGSEQKLEQVWT